MERPMVTPVAQGSRLEAQQIALGSRLKALGNSLEPRTSSLERSSVEPRASRGVTGTRGGQASLEMTVAIIGALLLVFGALRICLWFCERFVARQTSYEATRVEAVSSDDPGRRWTEPDQPLDIFGERR